MEDREINEERVIALVREQRDAETAGERKRIAAELREEIAPETKASVIDDGDYSVLVTGVDAADLF